MARLAGIEMKYPFAKAEKMSGHTQTGALQMWKFRGDLLNSKGKGSAEFDALKRTRSYELAFQVYQELKARNDPETRGGFEHFLQNCHAESNWFLAASF
jgi:hypothetical protein